eukprot:2556543-Prorocentrum_lima.AAC.1
MGSPSAVVSCGPELRETGALGRRAEIRNGRGEAQIGQSSQRAYSSLGHEPTTASVPMAPRHPGHLLAQRSE